MIREQERLNEKALNSLLTIAGAAIPFVSSSLNNEEINHTTIFYSVTAGLQAYLTAKQVTNIKRRRVANQEHPNLTINYAGNEYILNLSILAETTTLRCSDRVHDNVELIYDLQNNQFSFSYCCPVHIDYKSGNKSNLQLPNRIDGGIQLSAEYVKAINKPKQDDLEQRLFDIVGNDDSFQLRISRDTSCTNVHLQYVGESITEHLPLCASNVSGLLQTTYREFGNAKK